MIQNINYYEGSSSELIAAGLHVNGTKLDNVGISVLARFGVIQNIGAAPKQEKKRGKPGFVYRIPANICKVIKD